MHLLFGFSGRVGRREWWLAHLAVVSLILFGAGLILIMDPDRLRAGLSDGMPAAALGALASICLAAWIGVASSVKRFHDRNKSGWWFCIVFVPYIGAVWQLVECGCFPGTPGGNDYGSPHGPGRMLEDYDIEAISSTRATARPEATRPAGANLPSGSAFGRRIA